jgi:hypothetical protein
MQSQTIARAIALAAAILAVSVALLLVLSASDELSVTLERPTPQADEPDTAPPREVEQAAPSSDTPATAKARELEAMSETFRNTTFVTAIRDAGFVCYELLRAYGGMDGSAKWMATCSEMHAYTVSVASNGTLHVAPMLQYFDGMASPRIIRQDLEPSLLEPRLEPQPLAPQPQPQR